MSEKLPFEVTEQVKKDFQATLDFRIAASDPRNKIKLNAIGHPVKKTRIYTQNK